MLVYGQEILNKANKEKYGVGAFNFVNFEMLNAIFVAAHQARSPIFVQASEGAIKYMGIDMAVGMVKTMSKRYPHIPVALHLDHGTSFESCKKAVEAGFTSVMIDASHYQFNENLEETSKVVKMAHEHGVGVEAELGRLMGIEDNISVSEKEAVLDDLTLSYIDYDEALEILYLENFNGGDAYRLYLSNSEKMEVILDIQNGENFEIIDSQIARIIKIIIFVI